MLVIFVAISLTVMLTNFGGISAGGHARDAFIYNVYESFIHRQNHVLYYHSLVPYFCYSL